MSIFSGILGSIYAQPGTLIPGSTAAGGVTEVQTTATVSQTIDVVLVMGLYQRLTESVSVSSTLVNHSEFAKQLVDQVSATETVVAAPSAWLRGTQFVVETIYAPAVTPLRITQLVVEVAYKRDTRQSITSNVTVTSGFNIPRSVDETITSSIAVAQTIGYRATIIVLSVSHTATVSSSITQHGVVIVSVTQPVFVAEAILVRGPRPQTITSTATCSWSIEIAGVHNLTVNNTATATQTISNSYNPNRQSIVSAGTVTTGIGTAGINDFISVNTNLTVGQTIGVRSTVVRLSVTSHVNVTSFTRPNAGTYFRSVESHVFVSEGTYFRNTNVRIGVTTHCNVSVPEEERSDKQHEFVSDSLTVTSDPEIESIPRLSVETDATVAQTINVRNTNPRLYVWTTALAQTAVSYQSPNDACTSSITAYQAISLRNDNVRLSVSTHVSVDQTIFEHPDVIRIAVEDTVTVQKYDYSLTNRIVGYSINPNRQPVSSFITVNATIIGGNSSRGTDYTEYVSVNQIIESNFQQIAYTDAIQTDQEISLNTNPNRQTVETDLTVASIISQRSDTIHITVEDDIAAIQTVVGHGPITKITYIQNLVVASDITARAPKTELLADSITCATNVAFDTSPSRQSPLTQITVDSEVIGHSDQPRESVLSTGTVTSTVRLAEIIVRSFVGVYQTINRTGVYHILQELNLEDSVRRVKHYTQDITQSLELDENVARGNTCSRSLHDYIVFDDPYRNVWTDLSDQYVPIPILIGVKVEQYVTISATSQTIVLPPPKFDDSKANVASLNIKRSITGLSYVHVKRTDRVKLNWPFKLGLDKATELKLFMETAISQQITVTDWEGNKWLGYFTCDPFEFKSEDRYAGEKEKIDITLEFEAIKLT